MTTFTLLKFVHVSCALLSIAGFTLRGYWVLSDNPLRQSRLARVLPHLVDTLLLASALGMLWLWQISPFAVVWIAAKILALLLYIALGVVLMRFAKTPGQRRLAYASALLVVWYIVAVALSHSALGPLAWI